MPETKILELKRKKEILNDRELEVRGFRRENGFLFGMLCDPRVKDALLIRSPEDADIWFRPWAEYTLEDCIHYITQKNITSAIIIARDLSFLNRCPSLRNLEIFVADDCENIDFSPLYSMPDLRYLMCHTFRDLGDYCCGILDYRQLRNVEVLYARKSKQPYDFRDMSSLKFLSMFEGKTPNRNLSIIKGCGSLKTLDICQCNLTSLSGIDSARDLECLSLNYMRSLRDISEIKRVSNSLKHLEIGCCAKIEDFSVLGDLRKIEYLKLWGSTKLKTISFIENMPCLKHFSCLMNIEDGDLSYCKNIEYIYIKNRKHYNLKNEDLPKG